MGDISVILDDLVFGCVKRALSSKEGLLWMGTARGNDMVTFHARLHKGEEPILELMVWQNGVVQILYGLDEMKDTLIDTTKLVDMETELATAIAFAVNECLSERGL